MKKMKYIAFALALVFCSGGCTHLFDNYNDDPNNQLVGAVLPESLMEEIIYQSALGMMTRCNSITGELIQYTATGTSSQSLHRYYVNLGTNDGAWNNLARYAVNADHMYQVALEQGSRNFQAIGLTLRAFLMSNMTDIWGDIPYTDAFTMWTDNPVEKMRFDEQKDIYASLLEDLATANNLYSTAEAFDVTTRDKLYGGDLNKWRKFTNSLRLRLLMRLSNRDGQEGFDISGQVREMLMYPDIYPVFESLDDAAVVRFTGENPFINTYGDTESNSWNSRRAAQYMISLLDDMRDPRLTLYYTMSGTDWEGNPSGMPLEDMAGVSAATLNKNNLGQYDSPYAFMKYDEILFIRLEAIYRGWLVGGETVAEDVFKDAMRASVGYWNDVNTQTKLDEDLVLSIYHGRNPYQHTLQFIMTQKYIALFWTGYEAWHEYRRTEFPALPIGTQTENDGILPRRFEYPTNTRQTNMDNYNVVLDRLARKYRNGGDNMKTPVWWSKAAIENER